MPDGPDASSRAVTDLMGHPAVDRARAAQHLVRTVGYQPERFARMRDEAVHAALADGVAPRRIAEALEVLEEEVLRMSHDHSRGRADRPARVSSLRHPEGDMRQQ